MNDRVLRNNEKTLDGKTLVIHPYKEERSGNNEISTSTHLSTGLPPPPLPSPTNNGEHLGKQSLRSE